MSETASSAAQGVRSGVSACDEMGRGSLTAELSQPASARFPEVSVRRVAAVERPATQRQRSLQARPREILLASSYAGDVSLLKSILASEGFAVSVTKDEASTVSQAKEIRPDLILIDSGRSAIDGLAVARQLEDDEQTCFVPVLLLCSTDDLCLRVWDADLDSLDFLRKPCSPVELQARIEKSLSQADTKRRLRQTASVDELTGLGNLRCLRERLASEKSRLERHGTPMAVMMIDVDKLKGINDRYGHSVGSDVLMAVAATLRSEIRDTDTAVRYGGDEFVVMLPHTSLTAGSVFALRVLGHSRQLRPQGISISLSIGIAAWQLEQVGNRSVDDLLAQADSAAYRAKRSGGDQICVYDRAQDPVGAHQR